MLKSKPAGIIRAKGLRLYWVTKDAARTISYFLRTNLLFNVSIKDKCCYSKADVFWTFFVTMFRRELIVYPRNINRQSCPYFTTKQTHYKTKKKCFHTVCLCLALTLRVLPKTFRAFSWWWHFLLTATRHVQCLISCLFMEHYVIFQPYQKRRLTYQAAVSRKVVRGKAHATMWKVIMGN